MKVAFAPCIKEAETFYQIEAFNLRSKTGGENNRCNRVFLFLQSMTMKLPAKKIINFFCLGFFLLSVAACSKSESANQNNNSAAVQANAAQQQQATKDDVEELGKIIRLPLAPEEATYRADGKKLTAVLKFSAADAAQIAAQAEKYKPASPSEIEAEDWFPAELVAQSQLSGDETLKGATLAADEFFAPPFTSGKLTRVGDTAYFVLELAAAP